MLSPTIFSTYHPLLCLAPLSNVFPRHPHTASYIIYLLSRRDFHTHSYLTKEIWVFSSLSFSISLPQIKKQKIYEAFFNVSDTRAGAISVASSWKERVKRAWKHFFKFLWCYIYILSFSLTKQDKMNHSFVLCWFKKIFQKLNTNRIKDNLIEERSVGEKTSETIAITTEAKSKNQGKILCMSVFIIFISNSWYSNPDYRCWHKCVSHNANLMFQDSFAMYRV